jgi:hypothetical protein
MNEKNYCDDLQKAKDRLADMLNAREQLEVDIARQKKRVAALAELCDASADVDQSIDLDLGGLTEACKTVLRGSRKSGMTTADIQVALKEIGFPMNEYKAPHASILTTVNRMVDSGEVVIKKSTQPGASEYTWVGPMYGLGPARKHVIPRRQDRETLLGGKKFKIKD